MFRLFVTDKRRSAPEQWHGPPAYSLQLLLQSGAEWTATEIRYRARSAGITLQRDTRDGFGFARMMA